MRTTRLHRAVVGSAVCVTALLYGGAGQASAGEITGTGTTLYTNDTTHALHGASDCAYSGLNDDYVLGDHTVSRTQTFPQYKRDYDPTLPPGTPGYASNPHGR
jgi:hypothetical protein